MPTQLTTRTRELGDSRVRVDVEVEPAALEREVDRAARQLGRDLRLPGFRKGKVPPQVVIQRVGRDAVVDEALRRALPEWYEQAVHDARLATVGDPKLDIEEVPPKGAPLAFSIEVAVRPPARLGAYKGLEVGRAEPEVSDEEIDAEVERLRDSVASLESVDRPAGDGDFLVLDFAGSVDGKPFEGGEARGYLLELGSGRLIEGFEEQLRGASAGERREVRVTLPGDQESRDLAGKEAVFDTTVKEVKEKRLPQLDDEFATEAGGFDTLQELREDIRSRITELKEEALASEFRESVVDAAAGQARIELPPQLVEAKAREMWRNAARGLARQGVDPARYLAATGRTEDQIVEEAKPEAERAVRRESVLAAVVQAEGIEVSDAELIDSIRAAASAAEGPVPSDEKLERSLEQLRADGRDELLREDIAMRKALDLLVEHAKPISVDKARARDKLWTPEKGAAEAEAGAGKPAAPKAGRLWTPG